MMGFKSRRILKCPTAREHHGILAALAHHPVAWFRDYLFLPLEIATRSNPADAARLLNMMVTTAVRTVAWPQLEFVIWGESTVPHWRSTRPGPLGIRWPP